MAMTREELGALHAALEAVLAWPDAVRDEVARWLAPEAAKPGNGLDPHPPPIVIVGQMAHPAPVKPRETGRPPGQMAHPARSKAAEQRLLAAMQEHSGASVNALAKAAGANRSSTGEKLRELSKHGLVAKDSAGRWRLVTELAGEKAGPTEASPS
jgi:hypothetical protein